MVVSGNGYLVFFYEIVYLFPHARVEACRLGNFMASIVLVTMNDLFKIMNNIMKENY